MAEFKKINDTQVELHASPEEWDAIKTLLTYAADNYMKLELEYLLSSIGSQYFRDFSNFFAVNPSPIILELEDAERLRLTLSTVCYESKQTHLFDQSVKIVEDLRKFDSYKEFNIPIPKVIDNLEDYNKFLEEMRGKIK